MAPGCPDATTRPISRAILFLVSNLATPVSGLRHYDSYVDDARRIIAMAGFWSRRRHAQLPDAEGKVSRNSGATTTSENTREVGGNFFFPRALALSQIIAFVSIC